MDWPVFSDGPHGAITAGGYASEFGDYLRMVSVGNPASATWPAASRAIYVPFTVDLPVTATLVGWENGATVTGSTTVYVGIYDFNLAQLVTASATQTGTSAFQSIDITDTPLVRGNYWMAMAIDNNTSTVFRWAPGSTVPMRAWGIQQQATATPLPNPAVFANPATAFVPFMAVATVATM